MTEPSIPPVGARVHGEKPKGAMFTGYVKGHLPDGDVLVDATFAARNVMGVSAWPVAWLVVDAEPAPDVLAVAKALTGVEVEVTVSVLSGPDRTEEVTGFVGVDDDGIVWVTDARGSGSGFQPVDVRAIAVSA